MIHNSLTAVIPFHRLDEYFHIAVKSCIEDLNPNDELLLINDSSFLEPEVLTWLKKATGKELPMNVRILPNREGGIVAARNLSLSAAKSLFVSFLDSDDVWISGRRDRHLNILSENDRSPGVTSNVIYVCRHGSNIGSSRSFRVIGEHLNEVLRLFPRIRTSATTVRVDFAKKVGAFKKSEYYCEDFGLWIRLQVAYGDFILDEISAAKHRIHVNQISNAIGANATKTVVELTLKQLKSTKVADFLDNKSWITKLNLSTNQGLIFFGLTGKIGNFWQTALDLCQPKLFVIAAYLLLTGRMWKQQQCKECKNSSQRNSN